MQISKLKNLSPDLEIIENNSLKKYSYLKIGGKARILAFPKTLDSLKILVKFCVKEKIPYEVIGHGSNILFSDRDYKGVIISLKKFPKVLNIEDQKVQVQGDVLIAEFISALYNASLSGHEYLCGIPGYVLASVFMNAGTKDGAIGNIIEYIKFLDANGNEFFLKKADLKISYRCLSLPKHSIIYEVGFVLNKSEKDLISSKLKQYTESRKKTQPIKELSLGCVFKNPPHLYAAQLIDQAGLKGLRIGDVHVSNMHANFFINDGTGTAKDYYALIQMVKEKVKEKFNVSLELEIKLIGDFKS